MDGSNCVGLCPTRLPSFTAIPLKPNHETELGRLIAGMECIIGVPVSVGPCPRSGGPSPSPRTNGPGGVLCGPRTAHRQNRAWLLLDMTEINRQTNSPAATSTARVALAIAAMALVFAALLFLPAGQLNWALGWPHLPLRGDHLGMPAVLES